MTFSYPTKLNLLFLTLLTQTKLQSQTVPGNLRQNFHSTIAFAENKGQIQDQFHQKNNEVLYLLTTNHLNVQLKRNGFSYDVHEILSQPSGSKMTYLPGNKEKLPDSILFRFQRVDIELPGANPSPQIVATEKSQDYTVYYSAKPDGVKVYKYRKIIYKEIYNGIDLVFEVSDNKKSFEYYFIVKRGGDANQIRLRYRGAKTNLENDKIIINLTNSKLEERIPNSYVVDEGQAYSLLPQQSKMTVEYRKYGSDTYGFSVPKYNKTKTLIIDPTPDLVWGTYYGTESNDWALGIARDREGNIFIGGASFDPNLATAGAYQTVLTGYGDAMIGKFRSNGNLLWMTYFGGEQGEFVGGICIDNKGNILIAGQTESKTGISSPGCFQPMQGDPGYGSDGFLAKFSTDGSRIWATYYGGEGPDALNGIKTDAAGNIFVEGVTASTTGISTPGSFQPAYASDADPAHQNDAYIARFDSNGNRVWATYYGGSMSEGFNDLAIDNKGNLYAAGGTWSTNLASPGSFQSIYGGGTNDGLLVKFDNNGHRIWATYYGGNDDDETDAIACDNQNNIVITGMTVSANNISTPGTYLTSMNGGIRDVYVAKFNENGARIWGTYYGGNGEEFVYGITSDLNNNIIITGWTYSTNNITTPDSYESAFPGSGAAWTPFIAKLNPTGNLIWGTYYGYGNVLQNGIGEDVVTDDSGNVFACGETTAPHGVATCGALQETYSGTYGNYDMYVAMFSEKVTSTTVSATINSDQTDSVCAGVPVTFTAIVQNGGTKPTYQWKINGINAGTDTSAFTTSSLNNGDQVSCIVTSNSPCITDPKANSNVISVSIRPLVVPSVNITSSMNGSICIGTNVSFTASPLNGGSSPNYQWKINGNNAGNNNSAFTTSALVNGDTVTCVLTNLFSCNAITSATSNSIIANVSATISPSVSISASASNVCENTAVTFNALTLNAGNNPVYEWRVNDVAVGNKSTYSTNNLASTDSVQCFITADGSACPDKTNIGSNKLTIQVYPEPSFTIQPDKPTISRGDSIQLIVSGASNITKYNWSPALDINNDSIYDPIVWPKDTRTYTLTTTSSQGCIFSKGITVSVLSGLFIPTAFTPNHDGLNDVWIIQGLESFPGCKVTVFNRWGEVVYKSYGYSKPWDGRFNGQELSSTTFVYLIELKKGVKPMTGTVTIIR